MNTQRRNPGDPIQNLAIGKIIEADGSRIVAELDPRLTELSRVYGGETYPIGQFGSIIRIHFGRRLIYALVGRLRMKAEYEADRGAIPRAAQDAQVMSDYLLDRTREKVTERESRVADQRERPPMNPIRHPEGRPERHRLFQRDSAAPSR